MPGGSLGGVNSTWPGRVVAGSDAPTSSSGTASLALSAVLFSGGEGASSSIHTSPLSVAGPVGKVISGYSGGAGTSGTKGDSGLSGGSGSSGESYAAISISSFGGAWRIG